jgi:hypothetical protein
MPSGEKAAPATSDPLARCQAPREVEKSSKAKSELTLAKSLPSGDRNCEWAEGTSRVFSGVATTHMLPSSKTIVVASGERAAPDTAAPKSPILPQLAVSQIPILPATPTTAIRFAIRRECQVTHAFTGALHGSQFIAALRLKDNQATSLCHEPVLRPDSDKPAIWREIDARHVQPRRLDQQTIRGCVVSPHTDPAFVDLGRPIRFQAFCR